MIRAAPLPLVSSKARKYYARSAYAEHDNHTGLFASPCTHPYRPIWSCSAPSPSPFHGPQGDKECGDVQKWLINSVCASHHLQMVQLARQRARNNLGAMQSDALQWAWGVEGTALLQAQRVAVPGRLFSVLADRGRVTLALFQQIKGPAPNRGVWAQNVQETGQAQINLINLKMSKRMQVLGGNRKQVLGTWRTSNPRL